jgi:hypothetical protein
MNELFNNVVKAFSFLKFREVSSLWIFLKKKKMLVRNMWKVDSRPTSASYFFIRHVFAVITLNSLGFKNVQPSPNSHLLSGTCHPKGLNEDPHTHYTDCCGVCLIKFNSAPDGVTCVILNCLDVYLGT